MEHPLVPQGEPELIIDAAQLNEFAQHIRAQRTFAFDTEFIGEVAYRPKTCLIQLATSQRVGLVDPLALNDVSIVWELVGDPATVTIVHAGASDLSQVRRYLCGEPAGLIDVQVAAGFVGMAYPSSLAKLVDRFVGHPLAKGHAFTDWDRRPLSESQLRYAADDVRYLPLVWDVLRTELDARGRIAWAVQETVARIDDPHVFDAKAQVLRTSRRYELTPPQEQLMEALCIVRDEIAQREDLPHRTTIPDGSLLEIVRDRPESIVALAAVRGLPRPIVARHGELLLRTLAANPSKQTKRFAVRRRREADPALKAKIDAMLAEAKAACEELAIAPALAITRSDLERYIQTSLESAEGIGEQSDLFGPTDWRRNAFGDRIERAAGDR